MKTVTFTATYGLLFRAACLCVLTIVINLSAAGILVAQKSSKPLSGTYLGQFTLHGYPVPFRFRLNSTGKHPDLTLFNADEKVVLPLLMPAGATDSLRVLIEQYDAELVFAAAAGGKLSGYYKRYNLAKPFIPLAFTAKPATLGGGHSAYLNNFQTYDLSIGKAEASEQAIGLFDLTPLGRAAGSVLTNSGDYRYMEGRMGSPDGSLNEENKNDFYLSVFSGASPNLLVMKAINVVNNKVSSFKVFRGVLVSPGGTDSVKAVFNRYTLTGLKPGKNSISFSLYNEKGKLVSFSDVRYKNKVVLVTLMGTWCPNCIDEARFLGPWYKNNKHRGLEVIGLSFERKNDSAYANKAIARTKARLELDYEILFAGQNKKDDVLKVLPELNGFNGYPTLLFIDRKGFVRKIHTGYTGPATRKFYSEFKTDFESTVNKLLDEK